MSDNKEFLHTLYVEMKKIVDELGLRFNEKKTKITKISRGFTFMKVRYRVIPTGKIIRTMAKSNIVRMRRKLKKFRGLVDKGCMSLDDVYNSMLEEKGITITELEIRMLIESAVGEFNNSFKKNDSESADDGTEAGE